MWVIEQFLGKVFEVDKEKGIIKCPNPALI